MGMILLGDANDFIVTRNCIMDGGTQGDSFFSGGGIQIGFSGEPPSSGFEIMDNSYDGNVATSVPESRDVWLSVDSLNNSVTERVGTVVLDEGASNTVVLFADDGVDHCSD